MTSIADFIPQMQNWIREFSHDNQEIMKLVNQLQFNPDQAIKWGGEVFLEIELEICSLTYRTFANFLAGQCLEAIILGSMFVLKSRYRILGSSIGFVACTKF